MPIYTRTGDRGETDLIGARARKDAAVLEICGTLDELNSFIGLARCEPMPSPMDAALENVQRRLFDLGGTVLASNHGQACVSVIGGDDVSALERLIDELDASLAPIGSFVLPAGTRAAALLHVARAVCRRAERRLVSLAASQPNTAASPAMAYINRLSDLLFVMARAANASANVNDATC